MRSKKAGARTLIIQHHLSVRETCGEVSRSNGKKVMEADGGYKRVWHILYKVEVEELGCKS